MSKLSDSLVFKQRGNKQKYYEDCITTSFDVVNINPYAYSGSNILVSEMSVYLKTSRYGLIDEIASEEIRETHKKQMRCEIISKVFGEFYEDFYKLRDAIFHKDFNKALKALYDFENKMFDIEE